MKKNDIYSAKIDSWGSEGEGICRIDGMAVFVKGAAKGDVCDVRILKVHKSHAFGRIEKLAEPSLHRIENDCPVFGRCGGCTFRHITYAEELDMKHVRVKDALRKIGGIDAEVEPVLPSPELDGYRNKAIYQVDLQSGKPIFGFYRRGTHEVLPVNYCALQNPQTNRIVDTIQKNIAQNGALRNIFIRTASDGKTQVCLITADPKKDNMGKIVSELTSNHPNISGILQIVNKDLGNVVMTGKASILYGEEHLTDTLCGLKFRISPFSFYQVNHSQTENLYNTAIELADLKGTETVLDLYCGIGTISLCLAKKAKHVIGVEIVPQAIEDAKMNASLNNITNTEFICSDAGTAAQRITSTNTPIDLITVDPPRKGLSTEAIEAILKISPPQIIYISCDPATLARDLKHLKQNYKITEVRPADMFARTAHVECVILMQRSGIESEK